MNLNFFCVCVAFATTNVVEFNACVKTGAAIALRYKSVITLLKWTFRGFYK